MASNDQLVWDRIIAGDVAAFQNVVEQHQATVSAVAYSILGDFAISQDIAQETFWTAWKSRTKLREVGKLRAWLCGIARNLARQWRRKNRRVEQPSDMSTQFEPASTAGDPAEQTISAEKQSVVWSSLEEIPEKYREVMILYYRQGQSIEEVAQTLEISAEAARQRLHRGRNMLRGRVEQVVEGVLHRSAPGKAFTAKVMAGLAGAVLAAKTAGSVSASTVAQSAAGSAAGGMATTAIKSAVVSGASGGVAGGLAGAAGGLGGAWLGTWLPAQMAASETERQFLQERGRTVMRRSIVFTMLIIVLTLSFVFVRFHGVYFVASMIALTLAYTLSVVWHSLETNRLAKQLREQIDPDEDPNLSPIGQKLNSKTGFASKWEGRCYTSDLKLFGAPLIDIQVSDPMSYNNKGEYEPKTAVGWIAIGDRAHGILLGIGGIARGIVAIGGLAIGAISFGGVAIGVISLGGLALGGLTLGGLAIGYMAFGGGAIGWDAAGGGAIGWHSAAGGLAVAFHAAMGGLAIARDFAVGGAAIARETNTELAEQVVASQSLKPAMDWLIQNQVTFTVSVIAISVIPAFLMPLFYRRRAQNKK